MNIQDVADNVKPEPDRMVLARKVIKIIPNMIRCCPAATTNNIY